MSQVALIRLHQELEAEADLIAEIENQGWEIMSRPGEGRKHWAAIRRYDHGSFVSRKTGNMIINETIQSESALDIQKLHERVMARRKPELHRQNAGHQARLVSHLVSTTPESHVTDSTPTDSDAERHDV